MPTVYIVNWDCSSQNARDSNRGNVEAWLKEFDGLRGRSVEWLGVLAAKKGGVNGETEFTTILDLADVPDDETSPEATNIGNKQYQHQNLIGNTHIHHNLWVWSQKCHNPYPSAIGSESGSSKVRW
jgi:hypothetical protein